MPSLLRNSPVVAAAPATCFQPTSVRCDPRCLFFVPGGFWNSIATNGRDAHHQLITSSPPPTSHSGAPTSLFFRVGGKTVSSDSVITARL
ncbi:hypothetical protein DTO027B5_8867 [Paecilomyces variotii]|nr:hypothetical protein DTO032I3_4021 [Paecilomyces variotii]KAJ9243273.1 hypothetical protein DTO169E5_2855 [Paecilomyces variotii]KAJ9278996.1 hypothetical protein DTO021D3_4033 [Paecilomyces variotii]KAJ9322178.1 hypothetical protein DTO027B3_6760 [Paecilomyces variotii]KAJ9327948.1 hypothetical protein DTO027B5_8867 [Paecilomyces variotii]